MRAAGKAGEFFEYDADHGFMNEQRPVHDRAHGERAWERMLAFWGRHLS
jgi:carboxymethylenebutenolidase